MNKKCQADKQTKQGKLFRLIQDYAASIKRYQQSLASGQSFSLEEIKEQTKFLKTLFVKLEEHSKSKQATKYFSYLKHIQFVLKQSGKRSKEPGQIDNSISLSLRKQAMIIEQQDQQIRRLTMYSSRTSLNSQAQTKTVCPKPHDFKGLLASELQEQVEDLRRTMTLMQRQNQYLRETNNLLMGRLSNTNSKLNSLSGKLETVQKLQLDQQHPTKQSRLAPCYLRSPKHQQFDTKSIADEYHFQEQLQALKRKNQKLSSKVRELAGQLTVCRREGDLLREKYLRNKHHITTTDSSQDILKRRGSLQNLVGSEVKEKLETQRNKKLKALDGLKNLVESHRIGIPLRRSITKT